MLGPLLGKELMILARQRRYYALRVVAGLAPLAGLWTLLSGPPVFRSTAALAVANSFVFSGWVQTVSLGLALIVPAMMCGLVAGERNAKTLDVLLTTPLHEYQIVLGKLAGRLLYLVLAIGSTLPVLAIMELYGGFALADILRAGAVFAVIATLTASLSAYSSAAASKPYVALAQTYIVLVLLWWVLPAVGPTLGLATLGLGLEEVFDALSPLALLREGTPAVMVVDSHASTLLSMVSASDSPAAVPAPAVIIALVYVVAAVWLLKRSCRLRRTERAATAMPLGLRIVQAPYRRLVGLMTTFVEKRRHRLAFKQFWHWEVLSRYWGQFERRLGDRYNPLLFRNAVANVYDPQSYVAGLQALIWVAFIGAALCFGWFMDPDMLTDRSVYSALISSAAGALFLVTLVLAASSIARERQSGAWDLLLLTDLAPGQIIIGTIWGVLRAILPMAVLLLVATIVVGLGRMSLGHFIGWLVLVFSILGYFVVCWIAASMVGKSITDAVGLALIVAMALCFLPTLINLGEVALYRSYGPYGAHGRRPFSLIPVFAATTLLALLLPVLFLPEGRRFPRMRVLSLALSPIICTTAMLVAPVGARMIAALLPASVAAVVAFKQGWKKDRRRLVGYAVAAMLCFAAIPLIRQDARIGFLTLFGSQDALVSSLSYVSWIRMGTDAHSWQQSDLHYRMLASLWLSTVFVVFWIRRDFVWFAERRAVVGPLVRASQDGFRLDRSAESVPTNVASGPGPQNQAQIT